MRELPRGWSRSTLGDVGRYQNGRGFKKSEWAEQGRPIIRIQNLTKSSYVTNYFNGHADERHIVRGGDLLVSWAATLGVFVWDGPEAVLNQHIFKVESGLHKQYHRYLLEHTLSDLRRQAHGSGMVHVTKGRFDATPVLVPPLPEQRRIVAAIEEHFSRLDAAAASLTAAGHRIDLLESTAVNLAFADITERVPLGDLAEVRGGIQKQPKRKPTSNPHSFLRVANVKRNRLELDDVHEIELFDGEIDRFRLAEGDLLVVEGNGSQEQIGRSALWTGEIENCVHQNHLIRVRPGATLNPRFLNAFWNSPINSRQLTAVASSTSGLYTLSTSKLNRVLIPVAGSTSQARIADQLDDIRLSIDRLRAQMRVAWQRSAAMRRSVLAAAFSGQLVQQDPSDEPASVLLERIAAYRAAAKPSPRKRVTA
jgi:type I restriction enzyme S subunit